MTHERRTPNQQHTNGALPRIELDDFQKHHHDGARAARHGSSANIGARTISALYENLEGKAGTNGEGLALFARIEKEFAVVREALEAERRGIRECAY